jgi:hypothetical protein
VRSGDLGGHPVRLLSLGYVKDTVYSPPLVNNIQDLRQLIITAMTVIEEDLLEKVWQKLDYRLDV